MAKRAHNLFLGLILLGGAILLFVNLGRYDVWGDEALTFPKGHNISQVLTYLGYTGGLVHPPLYSLVQLAWMSLVGWGTAANRFIWAFFGFVNLVLVYLAGRELFNRKVALVATFLCATSPFLVMYSRMVRYYTLTTLAVLLVIWFFARFRRTGRRSDWALFTLSGLVLLYEDYLGFFVLIFIYLYLLVHFNIYRVNLKQWLLTPAVIFVLFLPWMPTLFDQMGKNDSPYPGHVAQAMQEAPRVAQKAMGLRGLAFNSVLKGGFLYYIFTLGETTYFWHWLIALPVMAIFGFLFVLALKRIRGPDASNASWLMIVLLCVTVATVIFSEVYGIFGSRMFQFPSKVMFLLPPFILLVVWGWEGLRNRVVQAVLILLIAAGNVYGLSNYYGGRQFLNPKFLVPWRQIDRDIQAQAQPQDLVLTDEEAFMHQLKISGNKLEVFGLVGALEKVDQVLQQRGPHQVFLVIRYRGDETITIEALSVCDKLKARYSVTGVWTYVPTDPEAAPFWKHLLGKEPNPHLVEVYVFNVAAPAATQVTSTVEVDHAGQTKP